MGDVQVSRGPRLRAAERADQLLDVAGELFVAHGYEATSIKAIAQAAGVSTPIVYQHHGSKEGVFRAWVDRTRAELVEEYRAALAARDRSTSPLAVLAEVWFRYVESDPVRWELIYGGGVQSLSARVRDEQALGSENLDFYLGEFRAWAGPDVSAQQMAAYMHMVTGAGVELARWWLANPGVARRQVVDHLVDFCGPGIARLADDGRDDR